MTRLGATCLLLLAGMGVVVGLGAAAQKTISKAIWQRMTRCTLSYPGDYNMFNQGGERVSIGGQQVGLFVGGFQTLSHDIGLFECVMSLEKDAPPDADTLKGLAQYKNDFYDLNPVTAISGMPLYDDRQPGPKRNYSINFYNKFLFRWLGKNIPDPNWQVDGVKFSQIYMVVYRQFMRTTALAFQHLQRSGQWKPLLKRYRKAGYAERLNIRSEFRKLLAEADHRPKQMDDVDYYYHAGHAVTFWLRRGMDGTAFEIWTALIRILNEYDRDFVASLIQNK